MSLKDKLEIGLKPDAPFRPDNLPDFQRDDPACKEAATPGDAHAVERAREECETPPEKPRKPARGRTTKRR
jgi:hypothetical protein